MSLASFADFEGIDFAAFAACVLIGYFTGTIAPAGSAVALFLSILVAYHLFLVWLVFFSNGHKRAGVSLPVVHTVLTHACCLIVILSPVALAHHTIAHLGAGQDDPVAGMEAARHSLRVFQALCSSAAGLALFERRWLFSSEAPLQPAKAFEAPVAPILLAATGEDFQAWQQHLAQQKKGPRPLGVSLKTEYEQWLLARQQARATQSANGEPQG